MSDPDGDCLVQVDPPPSRRRAGHHLGALRAVRRLRQPGEDRLPYFPRKTDTRVFVFSSWLTDWVVGRRLRYGQGQNLDVDNRRTPPRQQANFRNGSETRADSLASTVPKIARSTSSPENAVSSSKLRLASPKNRRSIHLATHLLL